MANEHESMKPGEVVTITGSGFKSSQKNTVNITTASGEVVSATVTFTSDTAATFVMPDGAGLSLTEHLKDRDKFTHVIH
jgi:hypothetical protein